MATVFVSYAREDLPAVQQLEQALAAQDITVWWDQASLYGGQQWPKAIGEAIAAHDVVLLIWSQAAAQSHFVEAEWNIAVALRKTVLPCVLDETPLPATLQAINHIDLSTGQDAVQTLLQAVQHAAANANREPDAQVVERLGQITDSDPTQVTQAVHTAMRPPGSPAAKRPWEKWQTWVAFAAAVVAILGFLLAAPDKVHKWLPLPGQREIVQPLAGIVWDEHHKSLAGVNVVLPQQNQTTMTDANGYFAFQVKAAKQRPRTLAPRCGGAPWTAPRSRSRSQRHRMS
jgi:hypothetical protein